MAGIRTTWRVTDDGEFFCPACGGDRCYQQLTGRRRLAVLGIPLLARGPAGPLAACVSCNSRFTADVLDTPTTTRLGSLLRDAVHTVALALLMAGGTESRAAREAAVQSVRSAGFADCTEERLLTLLAALSAEGLPAVELELREDLAAVSPHLAPPGRESLLLHGARIALADGPYGAEEIAVLSLIGGTLRLSPADTDLLLAAAARTPS
ncbi:TerB family tellurite resistance protein [Streptomyces sp. ACA25]|nr:TerB family tellurite resistance protein [Streptomyces sp. ACA25]MDB1088233.1 TerB family tellurite resistance protein [Streptomyces sp. ACA25]